MIMATKEPLKTRWIATNAVELNDDYSSSGTIVAVTDKTVDVCEASRSVDMDSPSENQESNGEKQAYGLPISAKLAVALIAALQTDLQGLDKFFLQLFTSEQFQKENWDYLENDPLKLLRELLIRSSAITIDKNVILKTLSQPGCEGVRFYLCKKVIKDEYDTNTPYLSLVTVGVDAKGQDLHYKYEPGRMSQGPIKANLENTSFLSEYGSPPPPYNLSEEKLEGFDNRFAILRYALDEATRLKETKA
jgi:hypothetical protein